MSYADDLFIKMCTDIIENGYSTEGEKVRPVWEDGTPAYTIKKFGVVNRYDLSKEFPAITLRKTALKTCTEEMLSSFVVHPYAGGQIVQVSVLSNDFLFQFLFKCGRS